MTLRWHDHVGDEGVCSHLLRGITTIDEHRRAVRDLGRHLINRRDRVEGTDREPIDWRHTALSWEQREHQGRAA